MKVHQTIRSFSQHHQSTVLTIGTFDGVHIGHQKIIERLNKLKKDSGSGSAILTFYPHPRRVLKKDDQIKMLTTFEEKVALLEKFKLDHLIVEPFTEEFSNTPAEAFVKNILIDQLKVKKLVIGHDHKFGRNREGDFETLLRLGKKYGFEVEEIPSQDIENIAVSSTKIRKALLNGEIDKANAYLGHPYFLSGAVVPGKGIGRTLTFPTINLNIDENYKLIPKTGVYSVQTRFNKEIVFGVMNIGFRPTLNGETKTVEIHLLDFAGNLYDENISIEILHRLRDEQKFDSLEDLKKQIQKDILKAKTWLENSKEK